VALSGNKLFSCGYNGYGQLGLGNTTARNTFTQLSGNWDAFWVGTYSTHALSGTKLFSCGYNLQGQLGLGDLINRTSLTQVSGDWIALPAKRGGGAHVFALSAR